MVATHTKLKVGYLGPEGTYSHAAAVRRFGSDADLVPSQVPRIANVFDMLHNGLIQRGVVPIENSTEGAVRATLDSFLNSFLGYSPIIQGSGITITEELLMDIKLNLLGTTKKRDAVKTIYAHEQAIAQSRKWLDKNFPNATTVAVGSNALAARNVKATKDRSAAAIASADAADIYKLEVIDRDIQDSVGNTTRFVVLGGTTPQPSDNDKTSLLVSAPHKPGALLSILKPLAQKGVNMTHLESRPWGEQNWEYAFFIEVSGHQYTEPLKGALMELEPIFRDGGILRILGSYPVASTQAAGG